MIKRSLITIGILAVVALAGLTINLYQNKQNLKRGKAPILIAALPRSGTIYMRNTLQRCFHCPITLCNEKLPFPNERIDKKKYERFVKKRAVDICHYPPSEDNICTIASKLDRLVLHVRDPRQCAVSLAYYLEQYIALPISKDPELAYANLLAPIPDDYYKYSFEQKLDWIIENYVPNEIAWLAEWTRFIDTHDELDVMVTSYSDLHDHPVEFFRSILEFNGIDRSVFKARYLRTVRPGRFHFRKGELEEWRRVLSPQQQEKVTAMIPDTYFKRFGWSR
ncbi:MAG: sulfotransferase domain-containing protein [Chlamydiales bacterium]|nr:sulfotransferase domain-containing protein [Chlamydiales bacterium]